MFVNQCARVGPPTLRFVSVCRMKVLNLNPEVKVFLPFLHPEVKLRLQILNPEVEQRLLILNAELEL